MRHNVEQQSPTLAEEQERLQKWREVRRQAAADPNAERLKQADADRKTRLDQFETDKAERIRKADVRRREEAEAIEARRMDKARAHLEALDDVETAYTNLLAARRKSRRIAAITLAVFVGIPTLATALFLTFLAPPVFQSTSILALEGATPLTPRNPLFSDISTNQYAMAAAFQMRARLHAVVSDDFEMAIDSTQGLITLTTSSTTADAAFAQNTSLIEIAERISFPARLKVLAQPQPPLKPIARAPPYTLLTFLISLSLFSISAIFIQSFRHYARN